MITKNLLTKLREYGYSDSDISEAITKMGYPLDRTSVWRQRTQECHSRAYHFFEKMIKKHEKNIAKM